MAFIHKLVPGQIVYSVRDKGRKVYQVKILGVDIDRDMVYASWNNNPPLWYGEGSVTKWRINKPKGG